MDCRTGQVFDYNEAFRNAQEKFPEQSKFYKEVPAQMLREKTGRNENCPCGSGIKFKKCCYMKG